MNLNSDSSQNYKGLLIYGMNLNSKIRPWGEMVAFRHGTFLTQNYKGRVTVDLWHGPELKPKKIRTGERLLFSGMKP